MSVSIRKKLSAIYEAARFRPKLGAIIIILSLATALLEGIGLGFLLPIIEVIQSSSVPSEEDGLLGVFIQAYSVIGLPLTLEYLMLGIGIVMGLRFGLSFLTQWLQAIMARTYQRHLRCELFESLMYGPIEYLDTQGSDSLLNNLVTETNRSAGIAMSVLNVVEVSLRGGIYLTIAAILSPILSIIALISLSISTLVVRYVLEPAYAAGDDIADANEHFQTVAQATIQGMRDVRLYNMRPAFIDRLRDAVDAHVTDSIRLQRNQAALDNLNQFANATVVFVLVYVGFQFTALSFAELSLFLFAVFRLSPVVNQINNVTYNLDGRLPSLLRVRNQIRELNNMDVPDSNGDKSVESVQNVTLEDVCFTYQDESVLTDVSFSVERGEKIALVGPSGAGKSTIVSLLGRLQQPDAGQISADDVPIDQLNVEQWRHQLAVVRQHPFLFDETLRENVQIGNEDATRREIEEACETAKVTEFLPELPDGYETELGEDGIRLSGGQKQRVAIARALIKNADVLILDEATSELDSKIERDVYQRINQDENECATITIAHDLSTISDADRIYTLVEGQITGVGTHDQLVSKGGTYADLYATQT